jgi:4-hydroxy-3-methylbut-2-enyl diphosphate reductase
VGEQAGATRAVRVDNAGELDESLLAGVGTVGLTSGASVPDVLVREVLQWLAERGFADVEEVETVKETLTFALPKELREPRNGGSAGIGSLRRQQ